MELTPKEILQKEFDTKLRGYDRNQVDDYLDVIGANIENKDELISDLQQQVATLSERVAYFENLQDALNDSILVAQEAAEQLKQNARKETDLIMYEGQQEAENIVKNAVQISNKIITETNSLRKQAHTFRSRLQQMVESQLSLIDNETHESLFNEHETLIKNAIGSVRKTHALVDKVETPQKPRTRVTPAQTEKKSAPRTATSATQSTNKEDRSTPEVKKPSATDANASTPDQKESGSTVQGQTMRINLPE